MARPYNREGFWSPPLLPLPSPLSGGLGIWAYSGSIDRKRPMSTSMLYCGLLVANTAYWPLCGRPLHTGYMCKCSLGTYKEPPQAEVSTLPFNIPSAVTLRIIATASCVGYWQVSSSSVASHGGFLTSRKRTHCCHAIRWVQSALLPHLFMPHHVTLILCCLPCTGTGVMTKK